MPTPKRQLIVNAVVARFAAINGSGDYNLDISSSVYKWRNLQSQPWELSELPAINIKDRRQVTQQHTTSKHLHELSIEVEGVTESASDPDDQARLLLADVTLAIGLDRTWGGLAYDTDPEDDEIAVIQKGDSISGFRLRFTIKYRTTNFDPYNA